MKIIVPVSNTENTVSRLSVKSIVEQLMFSESILNVDEIIYIPRGGVNKQNQLNKPEEALKLEVNNFLQIEYKETDTEAYFDFDKYHKEFAPIFSNKKLGVSLTPKFIRTDLELTFTYKSKSYNDLVNWLNTFKQKYLRASTSNYQTLTYNYTLNKDILAYLHSVYDLTENVAGYNISLETFMNNSLVANSPTVRCNFSNEQKALAINVAVAGCLGIFTAIPSEIETTKEPPSSSISFTYTVTYERIVATILEYQLFIHNQLIDISYLKKYADRRPHFDQHTQNLTFSQSINVATKNIYGITSYPLDYSNETDGFQYPENYTFMATAASTNIVLDLTNLYDILDLHLLTELGLPDWLVTVLSHYTNSNVLCIPYLWAVLFEVFEVNEFVNRIPIRVDSNFHLTSLVELNPRNRYYLRVSVNSELLRVNFDWLLNQPATLLQLLQYIYPKANFTTIVNGNRANTDSLRKLFRIMQSAPREIYIQPTVMSSTIITRRKPEHRTRLNLNP